MSGVKQGSARAVADPETGQLLATVEVPSDPERVFHALASREITSWWVRPGVFDTTDWAGEVRPGGTWRASGTARGNPYAIEGEFTEVDPPRGLAHTWLVAGRPETRTTVSYRLEAIDGGTAITLRQSGFTSPEACRNTAIGWETSFERLAELFG